MPIGPRGGNARQLGRLFGQLQNPVAVLDRNQVIGYANHALCEMVSMEAENIVGRACSWGLNAEKPELASLLAALVPPASAVAGKLAIRQLTVPIVFGSSYNGQLFVPLLDKDGQAEALVVYLGDWERIRTQLPAAADLNLKHRRAADEVLIEIRSRWRNLTQLHALVGSSPAITLAMSRAQIALQMSMNVVVSGPPGVGKLAVLQAIFAAKLSAANLPPAAGQFFPVNCQQLGPLEIADLIEVFLQRRRPNLARHAQQLVLLNLDLACDLSIQQILNKLTPVAQQIIATATSNVETSQLAQRSQAWGRCVALMAESEIHLPALSSRREDIEPLILHILSAEASGRAPRPISKGALELLQSYPWPNNVSQLEDCLLTLLQEGESEPIQVPHLPLELRTFASRLQRTVAQPKPTPIILDDVLLELEKTVIQRALALSPRNRARAARLLGISRPRLLRRIAQLELDTSPGEESSDD
ncbi:MAG: hypothetical protein KDB03_05505 [Planctomycetales bacterium]|nr:hypothetical protein [Planctomycetales bacterium]